VIGRGNYLTVVVGEPRDVYSELPVARPPAADRWWRDAVVYQVYVRSFADANGDGIGDLAGVRNRLPYLRELGVDALWFNPWYASPMADGGYDVADYRSIDPAFGTLAEAEQLIAEAGALGIRTIVDIVPNRVSNRHPWFPAVLASPPGSPERARFWFRPGAGPDGQLPPNGWQSIFGGNPWEPDRIRDSIESALAAHATIDAPATRVRSNHDVTSPVTRYGRADSSFELASKRTGAPADLELGTRRARAAALLAMALPGSLYMYQGEELGLPEAEAIPPERRQDPLWQRSDGVAPGRDCSRIPLPWAADHRPYGFAADGAARPWLDPPIDWASLTVSAQALHESSMLSLYRAGLRLRRAAPWGQERGLQWHPAADSVIAFARGEGFACFVNFGREPVELPAGAHVLIASRELEGGALPPDTTVWLSQATA
jgi:glycosidase